MLSVIMILDYLKSATIYFSNLSKASSKCLSDIEIKSEFYYGNLAPKQSVRLYPRSVDNGRKVLANTKRW